MKYFASKFHVYFVNLHKSQHVTSCAMQVNEKVPYAKLLSFIAKNKCLCTKLKTTGLHEVSKFVTPKEGVKESARNPQLHGGFDTGYDYDPNTPSDVRLATETCFCVGGAKCGCETNPISTNKKATKCAFKAEFGYYLTSVHIITSGTHSSDFHDLQDWQAVYRHVEIAQLDSFGANKSHGRTTPKAAVIDLHV